MVTGLNYPSTSLVLNLLSSRFIALGVVVNSVGLVFTSGIGGGFDFSRLLVGLLVVVSRDFFIEVDRLVCPIVYKILISDCCPLPTKTVESL